MRRVGEALVKDSQMQLMPKAGMKVFLYEPGEYGNEGWSQALLTNRGGIGIGWINIVGASRADDLKLRADAKKESGGDRRGERPPCRLFYK